MNQFRQKKKIKIVNPCGISKRRPFVYSMRCRFALRRACRRAAARSLQANKKRHIEQFILEKIDSKFMRCFLEDRSCSPRAAVLPSDAPEGVPPLGPCKPQQEKKYEPVNIGLRVEVTEEPLKVPCAPK